MNRINSVFLHVGSGKVLIRILYPPKKMDFHVMLFMYLPHHQNYNYFKPVNDKYSEVKSPTQK